MDVYFPNTIGTVAPELKGRTSHPKGRNRLMLDGHVEFVRFPQEYPLLDDEQMLEEDGHHGLGWPSV